MEVFQPGPAMVLAVSLVVKVSIQEHEHVQTLPRLMVEKIAKDLTQNQVYVMQVVAQVRVPFPHIGSNESRVRKLCKDKLQLRFSTAIFLYVIFKQSVQISVY